MDYLKLQEVAIHNFNIQIVENSTCWRRMHAHCKDNTRRICKWKPKDSYNATMDLFHEIGHLQTYKTSMTRAESESEATRWAIDYARNCGLKIKRKYIQGYKRYIQMSLDRAKRRGLARPLRYKLILGVS